MIISIYDHSHSENKFFIISVSKFKQYLSENWHFHILFYCIDTKSYLVAFLSRFCDLAHLCSSLLLFNNYLRLYIMQFHVATPTAGPHYSRLFYC